MTDPTDVKQDGDARRRLRQLLAIPERERTDEQWDEIVSLEIQLAPGNRVEPARRTEAAPPQGPARPPSRRDAHSPRAGVRKRKKPRG